MFYAGLALLALSGFIFTQSRSIDKTWIVVFSLGIVLTVWGMK